MITSIELKNWKTHRDTRLSFTKGTNVLIGLMGAGKSSIMDAISYALFGTFPAVQHRRVSLDNVITNRPNQEREASVSLSFTLDGNTYAVHRSISLDGAAKATLEKNGVYVQSQPQRVNEEVERILKIDYDLFSRAIYSEQNRLDYFLELRAADRKVQIDRLLGLDRFALAQENTTTLMNRIKDTIEEQEKMAASFDIDKLRKELVSLNDEMKELGEKRSELEDSHARISKEIKRIESDFRSAKETYAKKLDLKREIAELQSKFDVIKSEIEKIEKHKLPSRSEIEKLLNEANKRTAKLRQDEKETIDLERKRNSESSRSEAVVSQIKQKISERDRVLDQFKGRTVEEEGKKFKAASELLNELQKEFAHYQSQREETRRWISELEKHISKCPVCEREFDDRMRSRLVEVKKGILADIESGIKRSEHEMNEQKEKVERLCGELERLRLASERLKEYSDLDKQLKESESLMKNANSAFEKARKESEAIKKEMEAITERLASLSSDKEKSDRLEAYRKQVKELEDQIKQKSNEFKSVEVDEEAVERLQKDFVEANSKGTRLLSEIGAHSKYMSDKQKQIDEKKSQVERIDRILAGISQKKLVIDNLSKFKNSLEETQRVLRSRLISSINRVMQNIWPDMYPYSDYTGIALEPDVSDYILKVRTTVNGKEKWEDVEAIASGGERSIACLAMRVAFSLVLVPNLRWIILDEPTHNIDEQGLNRFIKVFNETLPRIIDQIFIITHDETLKQAASSKTYLLTRNKSESGATSVQEH